MHMLRFTSCVAVGLCLSQVQGQQVVWPHHVTPEEVAAHRANPQETPENRGIPEPPPYDNLRTAAEWEEIEALTISWTGYPCIQKQIVAAAQQECEVVVFASNPASCTNYLTGNQCGGPLTLDNVTVVDADYNSVWMRDYGANTVYGSWNDDRVLVDWTYNRPRPLDDVIPDVLGEQLGIPVYSTTAAPYDLMNTGGNWMSDGFGTAFASELIVEENSGGSAWWMDAGESYPDHTEPEIEQIIEDFHGVHTYIRMPTLPYDGIHHIDMHMKLLDESTLLVAEYPTNTADGPQINANISYVLSNFTTRWGTPFDVIRIPSPPEPGQGYPNAGGWYMTYTNSVFVNNTVLVPTYYTQYDTTALRIYAEALPGYNVVGIDCDSNAEPIIAASGAIHCITHSVGVEDPLIISHLPLPDTDNSTDPYPVDVYLSHRSGIAQASVWWTLDPVGGVWTEAPLAPGTVTDTWSGAIPAAAPGSTVYYYAHATATSGKTGARPMPAPDGWWSFDVYAPSLVSGSRPAAAFEAPYPNPASAITCVPVSLPTAARGRLTCRDVRGTTVAVLHEGHFASGTTNHFIDAAPLASGAYVLVLELDGFMPVVQRLMVR